MSQDAAWLRGPARMMTLAYECLKCRRRFAIDVSDLEVATSLTPDRQDACPQCAQPVGTGPVTCAACGRTYDLTFPHWHVLCPLVGGDCPGCGTRYQRSCIC